MADTPATKKQEPFDPNEHMMKLKSKEGPKDYLPVQFRLVWFRLECPQGTVETEEIEVDLDREMEEEAFVWNNTTKKSEKVVKRAKGYARFKATVSDGKGGRATGTKSESAASFADYIEKAECVPLDSEILTRRGFKLFDEIEIGEEVLAYDSSLDQCIWTPLRKVTTYPSAPISRLYGKCFSVFCTPDHSWPVYYSALVNEKEYEYRKLVKAYDLRSSQRIVLSAPGPEGDYPLTPRDAAILGWLTTDGSVQHNGNSVRSYICQSKQENVTQIRELVGALAKETVHAVSTRTFPSGRTYECLPQHRFTFSADETRRIFAAAGITGWEDLPAMVTRYSSEARKAMLITMMLGDGDKRGYFGKKRKPGVMEAWQILTTLEGFATSEMYSSSAGDVPIQRMKKRRMLCVSELTLEPVGATSVWCPTTDFGTWVMRQNGRVMITGNTGAIGRALAGLGYGTAFAPELNENHRIVDSPVDTNGNNDEQHPDIPLFSGSLSTSEEPLSSKPVTPAPKPQPQQPVPTRKIPQTAVPLNTPPAPKGTIVATATVLPKVEPAAAAPPAIQPDTQPAEKKDTQLADRLLILGSYAYDAARQEAKLPEDSRTWDITAIARMKIACNEWLANEGKRLAEWQAQPMLTIQGQEITKYCHVSYYGREAVLRLLERSPITATTTLNFTRKDADTLLESLRACEALYFVAKEIDPGFERLHTFPDPLVHPLDFTCSKRTEKQGTEEHYRYYLTEQMAKHPLSEEVQQKYAERLSEWGSVAVPVS